MIRQLHPQNQIQSDKIIYQKRGVLRTTTQTTPLNDITKYFHCMNK